ncbi:MAG: DUF3990 domain-containing protein [Treponema sp.]|nr:DUF3990 domain-containing protein [Treponema sp.]
MILYHGSYTSIETPQIITQEKGRDFGFGFYTTSIKEQAERWAIRTARLRSRQTDKEESAIVNVYNFDGKFAEKLKTKVFPEADKENYTVKNVLWSDF